MSKIRPETPVNKLLQGLDNAKRQIRQLETTGSEESVIKKLGDRPNLREATKLSARLIDSLQKEESPLAAQGKGLTEDRVRALLNDEDE